MRARCTRQAHSVRDRAIASNSINSVAWIEISITCRGAAIVPCCHLCVRIRLQHMVPRWRSATTGRFHGIDVLSCSPFQAAGTEIPCLSFKLFSMAATEQGRGHDHEKTVDHALLCGVVNAGPV